MFLELLWVLSLCGLWHDNTVVKPVIYSSGNLDQVVANKALEE